MMVNYSPTRLLRTKPASPTRQRRGIPANRQGMGGISRKPAHTVPEWASARQHQENFPAIMEHAVEGGANRQGARAGGGCFRTEQTKTGGFLRTRSAHGQ